MPSFSWMVPSNSLSNEPKIRDRFRKELAIYNIFQEHDLNRRRNDKTVDGTDTEPSQTLTNRT